jgi:integrase
MAALELWLLAQGLPPTIEAITKRVAGRYVSEELTGGAARPATVNRKVSSASSYWRWLEKRGHVEINVWANQSLSKVSRPGDPDDKRPFTDNEVRTLLSGKTDHEVGDAIRVAALSGMRLGEIYGLTVAACADGWFDLRRVRVKTKSGQRRIPVHPDLKALVERRTKGKGVGEFLFHEAGPQQGDKVRSDAVGKRFSNYRQRVGVHEKADGDRQSRIDFHSFRRWFITKARVGFDRAVVAAIVGHEAGNITDDVYSGGPDDAVRIACVASVHLPVAKP